MKYSSHTCGGGIAGAYKLTDNTRIAVHSAGARDRACALKHTSDLTLIKHAVLNGTAGAGNDNNRCGGILSKDADSVSGVNGAAPAHAHTWLTRLSRERSSAQRWGFGRDMSVVLRRMMALCNNVRSPLCSAAQPGALRRTVGCEGTRSRHQDSYPIEVEHRLCSTWSDVRERGRGTGH